MPFTKDEFYRALSQLSDAATEAAKKIPEDMHPQSREGKIWRNLLSRLPEQIADIKDQFNDPNRRTDPTNFHDRKNIITLD
jgi:hypothetical protein